MKQNKWNYQQKGKLNYYRDGGITINPKNEGKFTDFAKSIGMDVQAAAAHVLAHRDKYSPMRVKQANFARNAAKFKHAANGGEMNMPAMPGGFHYAMPPALALRLTGMHNTACPDCEGYLPQEQFGGMSTEGYRSNSPDRFNSYNIIPSGNISMQNVPHPVMGIDNTGMQQMMYPGANYQFPGQAVFEMPVRRFGGDKRYQQGGAVLPPLTKNFVDSTLQANRNLNWVDRYVHPNDYPRISNPDGTYSTHLMASSDNFAYPTIIQGQDGKLMKLDPKDAYDYAMRTGTFIKFKNENDAIRFADNGYKVGTQSRKLGGGVKYQQGGQARLVNEVPSGYVYTGEQQGKKYYTKNDASGLPVASGTGSGGDKYEQFLISQLGAGVSPEELAQKKYISPTQISNYRSYYKPQQDTVYIQPPPVAPVDNPAQGFSGTYLFDPSQHAVGQVRYASRNSAGQADPGSLNTAQQTAQFMFMDNRGNPDPSKGYYEIPADVFSNQMTGGTRTLRDTTGISQYRIPRTLQQGGDAHLVDKVPENQGYAFTGERQGSKYYARNQSVNLPLATGTGSGGPQYEQFLINQLGAGVSPEELVQKKYISPAQITSYSKYYKPLQDTIYTRPVPVDNPARGFEGAYLFDPNQHATAQVRYATRNSAGQADPGTLSTPQQMAQLMFVDPMGKPDPSKGYYEIPGDVFSNQMTGGTHTLRDTTGISQYRIPRTLQQGGEALLVDKVPENQGYAFTGERQGSKYYARNQSVNLPLATGTGSGGPQYEQFLINQLGAGVSPQELVQKKYISPAQIASYSKYYKPLQDTIYTRPAPVDNPARGFEGAYLFDPNQHATAQVRYATRNSAGQADPGTLSTPQQMAQLMFVDPMGKPDPSKGYYEIPGDVFSNQMTGGTHTLRDTTGISQYRIPRTYQQGGGYNPFSFDPNIASTFLAGQNPGFVNYMNQNAIASKTNSTPWGVNPPPRPLINPDMGATYLAGQDPGLSKFLERKKIASKDNQNPSGVNDSYGPDPEPKTTTKTYHTANPMLAGASVAGLSFFNNALEANDRNRYNYLQRLRGMSDSFGPVAPGSRGDYSLNEGYFRPNQNVPVQFGAMPMAQTGGVFDNPMTNVQQLEMPTEINQYAGMPTAGAQYANMPGGGEDMPTAPTSAKNQSNAIVPTANTKDVRLNEKARKAYSYYVNEKDLPAQVAAGIVGNLFWESGLKTDAKEQGHTEAGRGIAQWDVDGRWQGFQNWAKKNDRKVNDLYAQLDYVLTEPGEGTKALKALMKARTPEEAAYVFGKTYERPLDKKDVAQAKNPARWDMRAGIARQLYNESQPANEAANGAGNNTGMYAAAGQPAYASETEAQASYQQGGIFQNNYLPFPQRYQRGGEYMVTPDQVRYILAHGGEIEFI